MTAEQDPRPRPLYGEYSDDAAEVAPNDNAAATPGASPAAGAESAAPSAQQVTAPAAQARQDSPAAPGAGPIPGVPHNLGVRGGTAAQPGVPAAQPAQHGDPYRGQAPEGHATQPAAAQQPVGDPAPQQPQAPQPQAPQQPAMFQPQPGMPVTAAKPRRADRIITVLLLVVGGYFALSMALSLSQLGMEFSKIADALGLDSYSPSPALKTTGTVGAILVLAIYALVLIFSIRRMRSGKLTFWAPLAAGVLAWIVFFVLFTVGLNQSPELWQELIRIASDPTATQDLLDTLSKPSGN